MRDYFPTLSATFEPSFRCLPGFGVCETTWPLFFCVELTFVIFPTPQWWLVIAFLAAERVLPVTFGTMHVVVGGGGEFVENSAVTTVSPLGVNVQVLPAPEQSPPDQPAKFDADPGLAVKVTCSPPRNCAEQADSAELQSISPGLPIPGLLVTVPEPFPANSTVIVLGGSWLKVAVRSASTVVPGMVQVPVPEQAPDQPANAEPGAGVAVRLTAVPGRNGKAHAEALSPQAIPAGLLVTIPPPFPSKLTDTVSPGPWVHCT